MPEKKIVTSANSKDQDEAAHNELPHLDLHYLPSSAAQILIWAPHMTLQPSFPTAALVVLLAKSIPKLPCMFMG